MKTTDAVAHDREDLGEIHARAVSSRELTIPVRPLLDHHQEISIGSAVRQSLRRLAHLLPSHPVGYRRYLSRMSEVVGGSATVFSWFKLKGRVRVDHDRASRALAKAEALGVSDPRGALREYRRGINVLRKYPLDPETLYQWTREVCGTRLSADPLGGIPCVRKVARLLGRTLSILEKERENMLLPNCRLVLKEVHRFQPRGMSRSDLFQEGIVGLQKAVFRYDARRGFRFSTYATYWIRQAIRKSLIDKSRMIRVPQAVQEQLRKEKSSLDAAEISRVRRVMADPVTLSSADSDERDDHRVEVADTGPSELAQVLRAGRITRTVKEALKQLNSREREIVERRFGLEGHRRQTLEEIGKHLKLSRERVRQIQRNTLLRLRRLRHLLEICEDLDVIQSSRATAYS